MPHRHPAHSSGLQTEAAPPNPEVITAEFIRTHPRVKVFVRKADAALAEIGYTEHGERHVGLVSHIASNILSRLGRPEREVDALQNHTEVKARAAIARVARRWRTP